jgi:hypothetical protein
MPSVLKTAALSLVFSPLVTPAAGIGVPGGLAVDGASAFSAGELTAPCRERYGQETSLALIEAIAAEMTFQFIDAAELPARLSGSVYRYPSPIRGLRAASANWSRVFFSLSGCPPERNRHARAGRHPVRRFACFHDSWFGRGKAGPARKITD